MSNAVKKERRAKSSAFQWHISKEERYRQETIARNKRASFRSLVRLLWLLKVTQYLNTPFVSDPYGLTTVAYEDWMAKFIKSGAW